MRRGKAIFYPVGEGVANERDEEQLVHHAIAYDSFFDEGKVSGDENTTWTNMEGMMMFLFLILC